MRIVIETDERGAVVSGGADAQAPGGEQAAATAAPSTQLAAAAAALGAIDAGPGPTGAGPDATGATPLVAVPTGAPTTLPGAAGGMSAGSAPDVPIGGQAVEIEVEDGED
jgi:hypothetical protein